MGREVRRVPADWKHPVDYFFARAGTSWPTVQLRPMFEGGDIEDHKKEEARERKEFPEDFEERDYDPRDYMPVWPESLTTHYQMYETCSEGTPISPVMATQDSLADWLVDNDASTFASYTATRDEWMRIILGADAHLMIRPGTGIPAVSVVITGGPTDED